MKGISFVILISLLLTLLTSCVKKHDLSQKEIFSIINEIVKDNNLSVHKACFSFDPQLRSKAFLYEFSKNDKKFILRQIELFKNLKINQGDLKYYSFFYKKWFDVKIDTICKEQTLTVFALPLISSDRELVILGYYPPGQGGEYLYKKRNEHWILVKTFEHWIE